MIEMTLNSEKPINEDENNTYNLGIKIGSAVTKEGRWVAKELLQKSEDPSFVGNADVVDNVGLLFHYGYLSYDEDWWTRIQLPLRIMNENPVGEYIYLLEDPFRPRNHKLTKSWVEKNCDPYVGGQSNDEIQFVLARLCGKYDSVLIPAAKRKLLFHFAFMKTWLRVGAKYFLSLKSEENLKNFYEVLVNKMIQDINEKIKK